LLVGRTPEKDSKARDSLEDEYKKILEKYSPKRRAKVEEVIP